MMRIRRETRRAVPGTLCQTQGLQPAALSQYTGEIATRRSMLAPTHTPDRVFTSSSLTTPTLSGDLKISITECITPDKVSLALSRFSSLKKCHILYIQY